MKFPYNEQVLEHFRHPRNVGKLAAPDGRAMEGSPACGDMVAIYLQVDSESRRITDIKFESYGCASNIATASIITELAKGRTLAAAKQITWQQAAAELGGLPPVKAHCSILAVEGLRAAIRDYEERHGLAAAREPTTVALLRARLRHVMNPQTGQDLLRSGLVTELVWAEGRVRVKLALPAAHQFAASLREEINDKLKSLADVREVAVEFTA